MTISSLLHHPSPFLSTFLPSHLSQWSFDGTPLALSPTEGTLDSLPRSNSPPAGNEAEQTGFVTRITPQQSETILDHPQLLPWQLFLMLLVVCAPLPTTYHWLWMYYALFSMVSQSLIVDHFPDCLSPPLLSTGNHTCCLPTHTITSANHIFSPRYSLP